MSGSSFSCSFKGAQLDSEKNIEATVMQCVKNLKPIVDRIGARNREFMNLNSAAEEGEENDVRNLRKQIGTRMKIKRYNERRQRRDTRLRSL